MLWSFFTGFYVVSRCYTRSVIYHQGFRFEHLQNIYGMASNIPYVGKYKNVNRQNFSIHMYSSIDDTLHSSLMTHLQHRWLDTKLLFLGLSFFYNFHHSSLSLYYHHYYGLSLAHIQLSHHSHLYSCVSTKAFRYP
jgi:hypothetical protein